MTIIYVICKLLRLDRIFRLKRGWRPAIASVIMSAGGMSAGYHSTALLGWLAFGAIGGILWFADSWYDPWVDCWGCNGKNKRRSASGEGSTFHHCRIPRWAAGCGKTGYRLRVLPMITGWGNGL
jgi:hypothetical protein